MDCNTCECYREIVNLEQPKPEEERMERIQRKIEELRRKFEQDKQRHELKKMMAMLWLLSFGANRGGNI